MPTCSAPSTTSPAGVVLHCDREPGHRGRHSRTVQEDDGEHTYQWGPPRRSREQTMVTLSPDERERLDEIARRWGTTRSGAVARLVREAAMPRAKPEGVVKR